MKNLFSISERYAAPAEPTAVTPKTFSLSWGTRVKGFGICVVLALVLGIIGIIIYFVGGSTTGFAILYSFAVICGLGSTFFLLGPLNQLKKMFEPTRLVATIIFLVCLILTLVSAFAIKEPILVLLFFILQFLALIWYALSYIPYARDLFKKCCGGLLGG